jgi:hypothetical protein
LLYIQAMILSPGEMLWWWFLWSLKWYTKCFNSKDWGHKKDHLVFLSLTHNLTEFDSSLVHCFDPIMKPMFPMGPFCIETTMKE